MTLNTIFLSVYEAEKQRSSGSKSPLNTTRFLPIWSFVHQLCKFTVSVSAMKAVFCHVGSFLQHADGIRGLKPSGSVCKEHAWNLHKQVICISCVILENVQEELLEEWRKQYFLSYLWHVLFHHLLLLLWNPQGKVIRKRLFLRFHSQA